MFHSVCPNSAKKKKKPCLAYFCASTAGPVVIWQQGWGTSCFCLLKIFGLSPFLAMGWIIKPGLHAIYASTRSPGKSGHRHLLGPYSALNLSLSHVFSFIFLQYFLTGIFTLKVSFTLTDFLSQFPEGEALYYMNILLFEFRASKRKKNISVMFGGLLCNAV